MDEQIGLEHPRLVIRLVVALDRRGQPVDERAVAAVEVYQPLRVVRHVPTPSPRRAFVILPVGQLGECPGRRAVERRVPAAVDQPAAHEADCRVPQRAIGELPPGQLGNLGGHAIAPRKLQHGEIVIGIFERARHRLRRRIARGRVGRHVAVAAVILQPEAALERARLDPRIVVDEGVLADRRIGGAPVDARQSLGIGVGDDHVGIRAVLDMLVGPGAVRVAGPAVDLVIGDQRVNDVALHPRPDQRQQRVDRAERVPQTQDVLVIGPLAVTRRRLAGPVIGGEVDAVERGVELPALARRPALDDDAIERLCPFAARRSADRVELEPRRLGEIAPRLIDAAIGQRDLRRHPRARARAEVQVGADLAARARRHAVAERPLVVPGAEAAERRVEARDEIDGAGRRGGAAAAIRHPPRHLARGGVDPHLAADRPRRSPALAGAEQHVAGIDQHALLAIAEKGVAVERDVARRGQLDPDVPRLQPDGVIAG